ncbi:MAG: FkbM family methyltransferase [Hormoscilla sp. GM7CHS1pb]|nr:FkbM family methyltransferase [Hormoscilla sp. GM7CHS1pb]
MLKLQQFKQLDIRYRRRLFELCGSDIYSRPAANSMDSQLEKYLPNRGFFIEAGAYDGFNHSNTYYLERLKGWRGILIEPIPELYRECVRERPHSICLNYALVSDDYLEATIEMNFMDAMTIVAGARRDDTEELEILCKKYKIDSYQVYVPTRTLTSILDEKNVKKIDLLSLDVESYELNVLKGLDFDKYRPKYVDRVYQGAI